jgi:hypothetical protein
MLLAGLKFGLGVCLGISVFTAVLMALLCLSSWISRWLGKWKRRPYLETRAPKRVEWKRTSPSAPCEDETIQSFSFCSVIRWEDRKDREKPEHRDGVR